MTDSAVRQFGKSSFAGASIVLVIMTVVAYWPVLRSDFVSLDDRSYVALNPHVLDGLSFAGWSWAWTTFHCTNWHPLTWLSLQLDGSLWGTNPAGYHATNLALHCFNGVLLFGVSSRLTHSLSCGGCVAALFLLHPLHVESVAWISERKDVLSAFFLFLTMMAYIHYANRPSLARYFPVMVLFAFGLLAKSMLVTLPVLLLLLDDWPLRRAECARGGRCPTKGSDPLRNVSLKSPDTTASSLARRAEVALATNVSLKLPDTTARGLTLLLGNAVRGLSSDGAVSRKTMRRLCVEKIPLFCLAFAAGIMTLKAQSDVVTRYEGVTFDCRIANVFNAYRWYLQKTFLPIDLTVFYPHPERNLSWTMVAVGTVLFCSISALVCWQKKQRPHLFFGWAWFVISLLPVIGLIQVGGQAFADRYAYIPHVGLFIAIVSEFRVRLPSTKFGTIINGVCVVLVVCSCASLTRVQAGYWKDSETLWSHALDVNPNNGPACAHLAEIRFSAGDYDGALSLIERGMMLKRSGNVAGGYDVWGRTLVALNRPAEAEQKFLEALKVDRNNQLALGELVKLMRSQKRDAEAAALATRLGQLLVQESQAHPESAASQVNLGISQARQGNVRQGIVHFKNAVQLDPRSIPARFNLAYAQMQLQLYQEAKSNLIKVLEQDPRMAVAHASLAQILEAENDLSGAKRHFSEAIQISPDDVSARQGLERLSKPEAIPSWKDEVGRMKDESLERRSKPEAIPSTP